MDCVYCDFNGYCSMFDEDIEMHGCDENGICICSSDEDPSILCDFFEEL